MTIRIGIPRALLYYYYFPLWSTFWEALGATVVVSGPTTKTILDRGIAHSADDVCLPVKLAFGHILDLKDRVDALFIPRLVSVAPREYICPKFLGLPDMIRHGLKGLPPVLSPDINLYRRDNLFPAFRDLGGLCTRNRLRVYLAYRGALQVQARYRQLLEAGFLPDQAMALLKNPGKEQAEKRPGDFTVALIGHPYNIYDFHISMNLLQRLQKEGVGVATADHLPGEVVRKEAGRLPKPLFWTLGQRMIGAAFHYLAQARISGIIHVASFACGPDSMTGELIERQARRRGNMPFLNLTLDEHSGEAGVVTRLEAFLDMIRRRSRAQGDPPVKPATECRETFDPVPGLVSSGVR
ncbi:hypothetical protein GFC01_12035 [Desulfofundulus thermobenzoicus]|uniref:DUF2229 domain-containing protein n=1 Tax=Desulfofundulus thermobenzoicus TaxID=29376 RepID=A0A6N7IS90_9FIRM|nr:acyl-CoA dehydratase activase-related protein [Desulfofundulus thermobenzoicus]MQL52976.1 hypothetical protein [Desulfofundulus thermobenzoicus]